MIMLNTDGSFEFYNFRRNEKSLEKETHTYAKGTWTQDKKIITFSAEAGNIDSKYTLDFNNPKARFHNKSPRYTSDRIIETSIPFYKTEVMISKRLRLIKE
tara:strand:- start:2003 stop:2305 length:303 start_codon:yes stop_codon:yes gene_type:complete